MESSNFKAAELSAMIRRSQEAVQQGKQLMERTIELLRESRELQNSKPAVPWPTVPDVR